MKRTIFILQRNQFFLPPLSVLCCASRQQCPFPVLINTVLHALSSDFGPSNTEQLKQIRSTHVLLSPTRKCLHMCFGICWVGASHSPFHTWSSLSGSRDAKCSLSTPKTHSSQRGTSARETQQKVTVQRLQRTYHLPNQTFDNQENKAETSYWHCVAEAAQTDLHGFTSTLGAHTASSFRLGHPCATSLYSPQHIWGPFSTGNCEHTHSLEGSLKSTAHLYRFI